MSRQIESLIQRYSPKTTHEYENALKEVIQEITLAGLSYAKFFDHAAFYGGTALRIFYGLPRFSEDLDFTLFKTNPEFKLKPYFSAVKEALESFGFSVLIDEITKNEDRTIESAFLKLNTRMHLLKIATANPLAGVIPANKTMNIKFEVDVYPPLGFESEVKPMLPPITGSVAILKPSSLFAGKMHAVLFREWKGRVKGRDFYDLLWYLGQNIPLRLPYLEQKMKDGGRLPPNTTLTHKDVMRLLEKKISSIDWEKAKSDIAQFIRTPREIESWSKDFFLSAISRLKCVD